MLSYFDAACFGWRSLTSKRGLPISRIAEDEDGVRVRVRVRVRVMGNR